MIYLDHNASTAVRPEVVEAVREALAGLPANPSSAHPDGRRARAAVERARAQVAGLVHARADEVVFTSGGTEGDHAGLIGAAWALEARGRAVAISAIEHHAVHGAAAVLARAGFRVAQLPVDASGRVSTDAVETLAPGTTVLSVMLANNETGVLQPVEEIAALAKRRGVVFHTDAVQTAGKMPAPESRGVSGDRRSASRRAVAESVDLGYVAALDGVAGVENQPAVLVDEVVVEAVVVDANHHAVEFRQRRRRQRPAAQIEAVVRSCQIAGGEGQAGPFAQLLTIENKGSAPVTYNLSSVNAQSTGANTFTPSFSTSDASVAFSAASVVVPANGAATFTATINPARLVGIADRTGSIAVGKEADLVLVEGDVSAELGALRRVHTVISDGYVMDGNKLRAAAGFSGMPR